MEERDTFKYLPKLQTFTQTMNSRMHRSIGKAPKDVKNSDAATFIQSETPRKRKPPRFNVGDYVRISKKEIPFNKGYKAQFTNEIFDITKVFKTFPTTYWLRDHNQEDIKGKFYEKELILYTP